MPKSRKRKNQKNKDVSKLYWVDQIVNEISTCKICQGKKYTMNM